MMTNKEWTDLIAKDFNVSNSVARKMLHAMYKVRRLEETKYIALREERDIQEDLSLTWECTNLND